MGNEKLNERKERKLVIYKTKLQTFVYIRLKCILFKCYAQHLGQLQNNEFHAKRKEKY